jgi:TPR repeat protein
MHQFGTGCKKDPELALQWLKAAADKGAIEAQGHLAQHYYGLRLYNKCFQWASRLEESGVGDNPEALTAIERKSLALGTWILGRCYERGVGAPRSIFDAGKLYSKAAALDADVVFDLRTKVLCGDA